MITFELLNYFDTPWEQISEYENYHVFQSRTWIDFIAKTQNAAPIVASVKDGDQTLGFFVGLIVQKLGLRILGSPLRGWSTDFMGFT
jgi:hypothetical protein